VSSAAAVAQDLEGLHGGEGVLDPGADASVVGVVAFFPIDQLGLAGAAAVWDE
jgi:hypothetical protein